MTGFIIEPKYIAKGLAYASSFIKLPNPVVKSCMHYLLENVDQGYRAGICTDYKTTFQSLSNVKYEVAKYAGAIGVVAASSAIAYLSTSDKCSEVDMMCHHPSGYDVDVLLPLGGVALGAVTVVAGGALAFSSFTDMHYTLPVMESMFAAYTHE